MGQPLRNQHSDEQMAELEAYATEVFGDPEAARSWLDANLWELDNLSPRQIVARAGQAGLGRARDVLLRIEYGVYSQGPCPRPTACFVQNTRPWTLRDWPKSEGAGTRRDL